MRGILEPRAFYRASFGVGRSRQRELTIRVSDSSTFDRPAGLNQAAGTGASGYSRRQSEVIQPEHSTKADGPHQRDLALARKLVDGCEHTWGEFVTHYAGLIYSRVTCIVPTVGLSNDRALVEDLVAEVFAALLNNDSAALRSYAGRSSLATYLCVIASRVAIRKSISVKPTNAMELTDSAEDQSASPFDLACLGDQSERLRGLIEQLPTRQKELVQLYHLQGVSYTAISQRLGIPIGSIGPTLKRAHANLRAALEQSQDQKE